MSPLVIAIATLVALLIVVVLRHISITERRSGYLLALDHVDEIVARARIAREPVQTTDITARLRSEVRP